MKGIHGEANLRALHDAVRDALPVWSLSPATRVELLNVSENATFLLDDPQTDRRLVLRVYRPGYRDEAEIRSELAWIDALRRDGVVPTPAPVAGTDGDLVRRIRVEDCRPERNHATFSRRLGPPLPASPPVDGGRGEQTAPDFFPSPPPLGAEGLGEVGDSSAERSPTSPGVRRGCPLRPDGTERDLARGVSIRHAVAFEHVSGREPAPDENLPKTFRALGAIAARLHRHARAWRRPAGFVRNAWTFDTMLGDRALWGDWRAGAGLDRAGRALLARTAEQLRRRLAQFGTGEDRFGLIHADLRLANLLADGEALSVIDFDDCGFGWFAYDFAASVSFFEDDPAVPDLLSAWLEGYRTVAPFAREDEAEIPAFVMLRRLLLLAWIGSHQEAPTAQALAGSFAAGTLRLAEDFLRRYG